METVQLAETRAVDETAPKRDFDQAWQEVLNHATMRVRANVEAECGVTGAFCCSEIIPI